MFKVGDRVICHRQTYAIDGFNLLNVKGTVIKTNHVISGVEFDEYIGGHDCKLHGKMGYCWNLPNKYLTPIEKKKIVYPVAEFCMNLPKGVKNGDSKN